MTPITPIFRVIHSWFRHGQVKRSTFSSSFGVGRRVAKKDSARPPLVSIGPSGIGGPYQTEIDVKG